MTSAASVRLDDPTCWVRAVGKGERVRLRLGTGEQGDTLVPTEAEAEHARAEPQRARAEQAEAEIARLRTEIERMIERMKGEPEQ
jgi:hypothetical protein